MDAEVGATAPANHQPKAERDPERWRPNVSGRGSLHMPFSRQAGIHRER